ncbi:toll-like receptor 4 [Mercenaria mercenaria]|uniref:toll-like receptor 4 n=1 Tax=Mercenaria mercenaria TaxID=6596 RepID=UPI00234F7407|nr:toll-like receptor 4 [Mercenaria mercenaria]
MDTMQVGKIIFVLVISVLWSDTFSCGPNGKCMCDTLNQMDCSKTKLPIWKICGLITNSSTYNVSVLYLEGNGYQYIQEFDLQGCDELLELYLGGNEITSIEKGSFSNLDRLELLDISENTLTIYDETVEQNDSFPLTMKTLKLNGNWKGNTTTHASYPDLSHLKNLEILYMDGLRDEAVPVTYRKIQMLQTIVFSGLNGHCNISFITNFTFKNLPQIRTLNMCSCNIENIHAGAFEDLTNLEILDLSQNLNLRFRMLRNISYSLQFTKIKLLNFSKVHSTFGLGTQLKMRDLCYFWNTTLTEILLSSNRMQLVETNALILVPETLKIMWTEDNKFTFGPYLLQLGCITNLEEFHGNYQNTAHRPILYDREPSGNFKEMMYDYSDCPYMEINILRNISVRKGNCIFFENDHVEINETWATFPKKLKRVEFIRSNMQYSIPRLLLLPLQKSIEYVDFSGNILHSWIGPIGPFLKLKYLNLSRNYCTHIGLNFFNYIADVEDLQLHDNFLGLMLSDEKKRHAIFDKLANVKVLNLSSNIVSYLPPTVFSKMFKLETLDLSVNNIETWTIDVKTLNSLLHLNLKFNFLNRLPSALRKKLESNTKRLGIQFTLDLRNNTFSANCDDKEFLRWMVKHRNSMLYFDEYIFYDKTSATLSANQFVKDVKNLDEECRSYTLIIVFCSIGISVFLAIVVGGVLYRNIWKLRYLMRLTEIKHFRYKKLHNGPNEPEYFMYDAFISYANEDLRFILDLIIPKLEENEMKLCLHERDFLPGNNIADNILEAIRNSRKTVVILSKEFLKSKWCLYEFNMARMESVYSQEGNNCLLVVMFENVPSGNMSTEMLDWIQSNTYIEYTTEEEGEVIFWENLKEALSE